MGMCMPSISTGRLRCYLKELRAQNNAEANRLRLFSRSVSRARGPLSAADWQMPRQMLLLTRRAEYHCGMRLAGA